MWLIANNLDFDRASTLPQVRFKIMTVKDLCVGLSFSLSRDGKCHILEGGMQVFNSTSPMHKDQIKNFFQGVSSLDLWSKLLRTNPSSLPTA